MNIKNIKLTETLKKEQIKRNQIKKELDQKNKIIEEIFESNSWKITKPFRELVAKLKSNNVK